MIVSEKMRNFFIRWMASNWIRWVIDSLQYTARRFNFQRTLAGNDEGNGISWCTEAVSVATCGSSTAPKRLRKRILKRNSRCLELSMTTSLAAQMGYTVCALKMSNISLNLPDTAGPLKGIMYSTVRILLRRGVEACYATIRWFSVHLIKIWCLVQAGATRPKRSHFLHRTPRPLYTCTGYRTLPT